MIIAVQVIVADMAHNLSAGIVSGVLFTAVAASPRPMPGNGFFEL
jgi:hypothetical protein